MSKAHSENGATMVETAFGMAIFLLSFYFLLWWSISLNVRWTIQAAASDSARLAFARGHDILATSELFNWGNGGSAASKEADLLRVLRSPSESATVTSALLAIKPSFDSGDSPSSLDDVSPVYVAAIAYAYERMRLGVGNNAVRYPCDPVANPGCLLCDIQYYKDTAPKGWKPMLGSKASSLPDSFLLRCRYQLDSALLSPLVALLRATGAYGDDNPLLLFTAEGSGLLPGDLGV